jgi:Protein of unknown function (DUF3408)
MGKDSKKNIPEINEELMMNLMVDGVKKEGLQLPQEELPLAAILKQEKTFYKEKNKVKKVIDHDYESLFFNKTTTNARHGKTIYIRSDFHEKLTRIVQVIGEDKITVYAYMDNLLKHHFQEFGEQITTSFNNKYKPIL